jgi:hypothetical protein
MSLKDLSDADLAIFAKDPQAFLSDKDNQIKVLGLDDPDLKARLQKHINSLSLSGVVTNLITQVPTIF